MAGTPRKWSEKTRKKHRSPTRVTRRHLPWRFLGGVTLGTALLLGHLWQKQNIKYRLKDIGRLNRTIVELRDENKRLEAKVTRLTSAGWIEKVARRNLGLRDPDHEPVILTYSPVYQQQKSFAQSELSTKGKNAEKIAELLSK